MGFSTITGGLHVPVSRERNGNIARQKGGEGRMRDDVNRCLAEMYRRFGHKLNMENKWLIGDVESNVARFANHRWAQLGTLATERSSVGDFIPFRSMGIKTNAGMLPVLTTSPGESVADKSDLRISVRDTTPRVIPPTLPPSKSIKWQEPDPTVELLLSPPSPMSPPSALSPSGAGTPKTRVRKAVKFADDEPQSGEVYNKIAQSGGGEGLADSHR